ncbi:MAG: RDD family protein [Planctomycetes bacterium]|nr:RDD family protein [Planctomycetota bacterium]
MTRARRLGACAALLLVAPMLSGCLQNVGRFWEVNAERVDGETYLVAGRGPALTASPDERTFGIYRARSADCGAWEEVASGLQGPLWGACAFDTQADGERLCTFHDGRMVVFRFKGTAIEKVYVPAKGNWQAETGAQIGASLYVFGAEFQVVNGEPAEFGTLRVSRYDGKELKELSPSKSPPRIQRGKSGFWLKAVYHEGVIALCWRAIAPVDLLDLEPPMTFDGPLRTVTFDGERYGEQVLTINDLPDGFTDVWSEGADLMAVVQPQNPQFGRSTAPRRFRLPKDVEGEVTELALAERNEPERLRMKPYAILRLPGAKNVFLRHNSQEFEIWRAEADAWSVQARPEGLPTNNLELFLLGMLGMGVGFVAMGLGMAFRRRRILRAFTTKIKTREVLAPLTLRISAFLVDLALLLTATEALTRALDIRSGGPMANINSLEMNRPFVALYLIYLVLCEWSYGATLGKWAMGLCVVNDKGERPNLWSVFVRNLVGFYERNPVLAAFAALPTIFLTPRNQRLGDLLARTYVVQRDALHLYKEQREAERQARGGASEEDGASGSADASGSRKANDEAPA